MGICRKLITGVFVLVVSSAARIAVRVDRGIDYLVLGAFSCRETSTYFSEMPAAGVFKKLNGYINNIIVPVKLFYPGRVLPKLNCG